MLRAYLILLLVAMASAAHGAMPLPRHHDPLIEQAVDAYLDSCHAHEMDMHSVMVVKDGNVVAERWLSDGNPATPHVMNSISKTLTATAIGFAINEGALSLDDRVVDFFPEVVIDSISANLADMRIRHLLTMSCGHRIGTNIMDRISSPYWTQHFLTLPVQYAPGTHFSYNTLGTYMLSAILQRATGSDEHTYLKTRLYDKLGIDDFPWALSPEGIPCGGFGAYLRTEDMAKLGLLFLQKGQWQGQQLITPAWFEMAMSHQVPTHAQGKTVEQAVADNPARADWLQGYGFQMWRMRHNGVRADGNMGQYILILPDQNAVIAITADTNQMGKELDLVWDVILPLL